MGQFELSSEQFEKIETELVELGDSLPKNFNLSQGRVLLEQLKSAKAALQSIEKQSNLGELKHDLETRRALAEKLKLRFVGKFFNGLAKVIDSDFKEYFIDKEGRDINKGKRYYEVGDFQHPLAKVQQDGQWYLIDKNGESPAWDWEGQAYPKAPKISEEVICFELESQKFYYRTMNGEFLNDESGKILYSHGDAAEYCKEGFIWTQSAPLTCVFRDETGKKVFANQVFESAEDFSESLALVSDKNGYFYIDTEGRDILKGKRFKKAHSFCEAVARIVEDGDYYFINKNGESIFDNKSFNWVSDFSEGFAVVEDLNQKKYYINKAGEEAFPGKYFAKADDFHDGYAIVTIAGRKHFIDNSGQLAFTDQEFTDIQAFKNGVARVHLLSAKDAYIDIKGRFIFDF